MDLVLTNVTVSVTELKRDFARVLHETEQGPVAVLNHNRPAAYLVSSDQYERLMAYIEDLEDAGIVLQRQNELSISVTLDEL